jgi:hypothetical protein
VERGRVQDRHNVPRLSFVLEPSMRCCLLIPSVLGFWVEGLPSKSYLADAEAIRWMQRLFGGCRRPTRGRKRRPHRTVLAITPCLQAPRNNNPQLLALEGSANSLEGSAKVAPHHPYKAAV